MATLLHMPEVAAGATEAVLAEWLVGEGAAFAAGQSIVVIETEKAVVDVEAENDAIVLRTLVPAGSTVEVGAPVALLGSEAERDADLDRLLADLGVSAPPTTTPAPERRDLPGLEVVNPDPASPDPSVNPVPVGSAPAENGHAPGRIFVSPVARRMLAEAGLRPEDVRGSGPNGRIVRRDVEQAVATRSTPAAPAQTAPPQAGAASRPTDAPPSAVSEGAAADYEEIPHSRLRRAIAARLTASKRDIPHFYLKRTANVDALLALRAQLNAVADEKISVNDLLIRAVAAAHLAVPDANVSWTDDSLHRYRTVDISVAIASDRGLVTPVLRGVESLSTSAISRGVKQYVAQAAAGKLQQRDLEGGSITITNLGMYGVDEFAAIINPPQSAILAVGTARPEPVVIDGEITTATTLGLVLSVDHRAIDGALAAQWMAALVAAVEAPLRLLV
ncbi:dihydrolipoamide acetyltransferase family protein [Cryptosporangium sp. NPDC048952]|uniref:dihydrolipoamide acetyltransferase family protein n=1 Tax=Cryptosporangium sp. NPDC048952 TaxID=3363961 RepID=UPI003721C7E4